MQKTNLASYLLWGGIVILVISGGYLLLDCEIFSANPCPEYMQNHDPLLRLAASFVVFVGLTSLIIGIFLPIKNHTQKDSNRF